MYSLILDKRKCCIIKATVKYKLKNKFPEIDEYC